MYHNSIWISKWVGGWIGGSKSHFKVNQIPKIQSRCKKLPSILLETLISPFFALNSGKFFNTKLI